MRNALETRLLVRAVAIVGALCAAISAHAGITSERQLAAILRHTPSATLVAEGDEMKLAEETAATIEGAQIFFGIGESMQPLYAPNTAVVVRPVAYDDIKKGMTVVYTRKDGQVVAHSVVGEDGRGYVVQGVNNDRPDGESVNETNLIGVVIAAYSANESEFRSTLTRRIAAGTPPALTTRNS